MSTTAYSATTTTTTAAADPEFFVLARERGKIRNDLPLWASKQPNPFQLADEQPTPTTTAATADADAADASTCLNPEVQRIQVEGVPGAFQLLNVISPTDAQRMVHQFERLGFTDDAAVSLPRSIRHNSNLNWLADDVTREILWGRCKDLFPAVVESSSESLLSPRPLGLNGKFRVYRYQEGDYFEFHTDGSWPESRIVVVNDDDNHNQSFRLTHNNTRWSMYTWLLFLTDDFEGGETQFLVDSLDPTKPVRMADDRRKASTQSVRTPLGGVLVFPHGKHPLHCLHASAPITRGVKYIIRSDVSYPVS